LFADVYDTPVPIRGRDIAESWTPKWID
jgi:hypothetical protein